MNKRTKKKLAIRGNRFHYSDWKQWKQIYDCAVRLYGKDTVDTFYSENAEYARTRSYLRNVIVNITNKHGNTVKVELLRDCYPGHMCEDFIEDHVEIIEPFISVDFNVDPNLENEPINIWNSYIKGEKESNDES